MLLSIKLLLLLMVANGGPIIARHLFGERFGKPVDFGRRFPDGRAVFGASKTWRGIVASLLVTPPVAWLLGLPLEVGMLVGAGAMAGDLLSSFIKRRLGMKPSSKAPGLDQVPESAVPLLLAAPALSLSWRHLVLLICLFWAGGLLLSRLLYRLHIRRRPY
jgi:CDP-2,3-bis-(O-geranylgeranyl)-sn-glycerol synthase